MGFEWDEAKRLSNFAKHGIDFVDAARIFEDRFIETEDRRRNYGERRYRATGDIEGQILQVVYAWRGDHRRIISAWRARRNDRRAYYASIQQAAEKNKESD